MTFNLETIATIASIAFLSITQIILIAKGKVNEASKLEVKKKKAIDKLEKKRKKSVKKFEKLGKKIKEIENVSSDEKSVWEKRY